MISPVSPANRPPKQKARSVPSRVTKTTRSVPRGARALVEALFELADQILQIIHLPGQYGGMLALLGQRLFALVLSFLALLDQ